MFLLGTIFIIFLIVVFRTILELSLHGSRSSYDLKENLTIASLLSEYELQSWLADPLPRNTALHLISKDIENVTETTLSLPETPSTEKSTTLKNTITTLSVKSSNKSRSADGWAHQSDDPSTLLTDGDILDTIFEVPEVQIEADWPVVLGNFDHFDDENWNNFLIKTEVPFLVRMMLSKSSESVSIMRIQKEKKQKKDTLLDKKSEAKTKSSNSEDIEMLIQTTSWILTHESSFTLGKTYIERDIDGTDSKNTFFFVSPRLLVHNKIKEKWRTAIIRHFHETGLNMTFIDRDRMVVARRFFHRIDD